MAHFIVTGSSTASGQPLYLAVSGWQPALAEARVIAKRDEAQDVVDTHRRESQAIVCDPYLVEVNLDAATIQPTSLRESIRANGPTVPYA